MASLTTITSDALLAGLEAVDAASPAGGGSGTPFLKMSKQGVWTYGAEDVLVTKGSQWAVSPVSFSSGFNSWKGGKVESEFMAGVSQPSIDPRTLPPVTSPDGWQEQVGFALICIESTDEDDVGTVVIYKTNNVGGKDAVAKLRTTVINRVKAGQAGIVPVITLNSTHYSHVNWGTVYKPQFDIVDWMPMSELGQEWGEVGQVSLASRKLPSGDMQAVSPPKTNGGTKTIEHDDTTDLDNDPTPSEPRRRRRATV